MPALHSITQYHPDQTLIAPSLLAADFTCLEAEVRDVEAGGAEILHLDIMDGHFVPNISFGPGVVKPLRGVSALCFDVHLMLTYPRRYVEPFVRAGADHITFHVECGDDIAATLADIHAAGLTAGLSLRPGTPACALFPYLEMVDMILVMSVEPGFGGQSFMPGQCAKIRTLKDAIRRSGRAIHLEVDGGIAAETAPQVLDAGANVLVAGSSVFNAQKGMRAEAIAALRHAH